MKSLILAIAMIFCCAGCDIPNVPVDEADVTEIKEKLDQCVTSLELAQIFLLSMSDELQQCIEK